jgi:dihydrofolate reductase
MNNSTDGNVVWHVTMSVDGFIAGPGDEMDWVLDYKDTSAMGQQVLETTGAILAGRRWYDLTHGDDSAKPYGGAFKGPVFVFTHRPPPDGDPAYQFLSGSVDDAVDTALAAARGKNLVLFGATIPRQCLELGRVDELVIHLAPLLLGDGLRLFGGPGAPHIRLERTDLGASGQLTDMRFRPLS